jgi:hypothetical protein
MRKLFIILLFPFDLFSQAGYDRNTQDPTISTATTKNTTPDATITRLIAGTLALLKRITALETTAKSAQASVAILGAQIQQFHKRIHGSADINKATP